MKVVTAPEHSPNPEYVTDDRPLFFHVEDSDVSPASQGMMVVDIFQIRVRLSSAIIPQTARTSDIRASTTGRYGS